MWDHIHPEIITASRDIALAGKYDDAIFAAFRVVEAAVQDRISSGSVGQALIAEAFDGAPPKILISVDSRDQRGIRDLFAGAFSNIRDDRGHKKAPLTPCESLNVCLFYLGFASLLLYLLSRDRGVFPRIDSLRVLGTPMAPRAELRGINFGGAAVTVTANGTQVNIVRRTPTELEILLPEQFYGKIAVTVDCKVSEESFCDTSASAGEPEIRYEVIAAEVPLYSDPKALYKRPDVVGLLMRSTDSSREFINIVPTHPGRYRAGNYVTHGPHEPGTSIGETWYIDPSTGAVEYAWTGSMIIVPDVIGPVGTFALGGISILPKVIKTQIAENRTLRVIGWGRDGSIQKEMDITERVRWSTHDAAIAFVKGGFVLPKKLGRTQAECEVQGFRATVDIAVEHLMKGQRTTYFQGMRRLQQIRFDHEDNLYVSNQGPSVFRVDKAGGFSEVLRISTSPRAVAGIDSLALDANKNLYVNDVSKAAAFKFEWDGSSYVNQVEIAGGIAGTKKSIAVSTSGDVFVAVMGSPNQGWIVRRESNGNETSFPVNGMPIWLAVAPNGNIYVPIVARASILVYRPDGTLADEIPHHIKDPGVSDIAISQSGEIYLALFHSGQILRIAFRAPLWRAEFLSGKFGTPGGIALDSHGRLYVSDFSKNSIDVVY